MLNIIAKALIERRAIMHEDEKGEEEEDPSW
jgi:hypothetical protein